MENANNNNNEDQDIEGENPFPYFFKQNNTLICKRIDENKFQRKYKLVRNDVICQIGDAIVFKYRERSSKRLVAVISYTTN